MNENSLCGVDKYGGGRYITKGIASLCEGLKQSNVTSLRCGACILNMRVIAVLIAQLTLECILFVFCSLAGNRLDVEGTKIVAAVLKDTQISNLKYLASQPKLGMLCDSGSYRTFDHVCAVVYSLDVNQLCGTDRMGNGKYTAEGITVLCEGLKQSNVTTLRCGACFLDMCDSGCYHAFVTSAQL